MPRRLGVCVRCGRPMALGKGSAPPERRACRACRGLSPLPYGRRSEPRPLPVRTCELCGDSYTCSLSNAPRQRFCSNRCAGFWQAGRRPPFTREDATSRRTQKLALSRARQLRHALTWDGITDEEILERDGWRCQIPKCLYRSRKIGRHHKSPDPRSRSIDHIVPLSLGGDDTAVNKRASHLRCNIARGNKMGAEQVALFGSIREPPRTPELAGLPRVPRPPKPPKPAPVMVSRTCRWCEGEFMTRWRGEQSTARTCDDCHNCSGCGKRVTVVASSNPPDRRLCHDCRWRRRAA